MQHNIWMYIYTVNREILVLKIFRVKIFRVKHFRRKSHATKTFLCKILNIILSYIRIVYIHVLNICCRKYFVCFIFVVAQAYENILTTKMSRFTVKWINKIVIVYCNTRI